MTTSALWLSLLLAAVPARAARRAAPPAAGELLRLAVSEPSAPYAARVRVQAFGPAGAAGKAKAQSRFVQYKAPGVFRVEAAGRKSAPLSLLAVGDGRDLLVAWPKAQRGWRGPMPASSADAERARLESLYDVSVSSGGRVARKAAWRLDLRSKTDGRLRRSVWLAKADGLVLRREDYRADGTLLRRERITRLEEPAFAGDAFSTAAPPGLTVTSSTVPFSSESVPSAHLPAWVPLGYVLFDASAGAAVFTDGVTSFTATELPGHRVSISGDLPEADLSRIAASVPGAP